MLPGSGSSYINPGTLWIDDIRILSNDTDSRSGRLHAQRTLLAALQAYREHRYADFARWRVRTGSGNRTRWRQAGSRVWGRLRPKSVRPEPVPPTPGFCPTAGSQAAVRSVPDFFAERCWRSSQAFPDGLARNLQMFEDNRGDGALA